MNLRDFEYLVALDEHKHFGKAANTCCATQPTLSAQIKKLESELGAKLIERDNRHVVFTPLGKQVVQKARQILSATADIRRLAQQASNPYWGVLRLGGFPTLLPYLMPHILEIVETNLPHIQIELLEAKTAELLVALKTGNLDVALIALPIQDDSLKYESIFAEEFVAALPKKHPITTDLADTIAINDLAKYKLLLINEGHCLREQTLSICQINHLPAKNLSHTLQATSLETLRYMVASGAGATLLPILSVIPPVSPNTSIVIKNLQNPAPTREIALVWRKTSNYEPLFIKFVSLLKSINLPGLKIL